jgi:hypothetical protein
MFEDENEFVLIVALDMCRWVTEEAVNRLLEEKDLILLRVEEYQRHAREREIETKRKEEVGISSGLCDLARRRTLFVSFSQYFPFSPPNLRSVSCTRRCCCLTIQFTSSVCFSSLT